MRKSIHVTRSSFLPIFALFLLSLSTSVIAAQDVRQIEIRSGWGGLGTPQNVEVVIRREHGQYLENGKPIRSDLVDAFLRSLRAPAIVQPQMDNLGVTPQWLRENRALAESSAAANIADATPSQKSLFSASFVDPIMMKKVVSDLFAYSSFDDSPYASAEVTLDDGSRIMAKTHSYYVFMIPWTVSGKGETFNADISRNFSALLPAKTPNKERLVSDEFVSKLAQTLMQRIEPQWKLRGVEDRAGDALAELRTAYTIKAADINPYHDVAFGLRWSDKGPHETNLQVTLHKASFPANMNEHLVLPYEHDKVQGLKAFLTSGAKYESLALSVPWLNEYFRQHPKETVTLEHVHQTSFGNHAMDSFARDMKARGREDLVPIVRAQQSQIALLKIDYVYWLLFPDKHMMLWRFEGPRGFLKWKPSDFPAGECDEYYRVNNGGCSGREVTPNGDLVPEQAPRDVACVSAFRKSESPDLPKPAALFSVTEHNRGGFIDQTGRIRIPLCFDGVGDFSEGLARFERDGLWGYIGESGTVVIQPQFPWAEEFSEGLAKVQVTGTVLGYDARWGYIDTAGKVVIAPTYGKTYMGDDGPDSAFHDGLAKIEVDFKSGYIDKTGRVVIAPQFSLATPFSEGLAAVTKADSMDSGWGYIDTSGKWVIAPQFDWGSSFQDHLAAVNRKHNCGFIDPKGDYVLRPPVPPQEKDCASVWGDFSEGLSRWKFGSKYGFIDRTGAVVIKPQFDLVMHFSEDLAAVEIDGKWGYIDKTGKLIIEPRPFTRVEDFHSGLASVVTKDGKWGYIDRSGKYVWGPARQGND
ncbi:MAG: WG repeat-containing protein [Acidobacteriaceae bacterium]